MIWLTWRQHRLELVGLLGGAIVLAIATVLIAAFAQRTRIELGVDTCQPTASGNMNCYELEQQWNNLIGLWRYAFFAFIVVPALVASYVGGPLLARELERGTHRLALTQGIGRVRWAFSKLAVFLVAALGAAVILALVGGQTRQLMSGSFGLTGHGSWDTFDFEGPALIGFMVFAIAVGTFLGAWQRRILAGMLFGLLLFTIVRGIVTVELRPRYEPPVAVKSLPIQPPTPLSPFPTAPRLVPEDAWFIGTDAIDGQGRPVSAQRVRDLMDEFARTGCRGGQSCDSISFLNARDVYPRTLYQPADRYWRFQATEGAIYLTLTVILVSLTLLILKRRDA